MLGAALGVVYDCFRVLRIIFPPAAKRGAVIAEDIIFWLIYGFCIFCYAAVLARGQIRFFILFGSLIGFVLYIVTIGNIITGIIRKVFEAIYRILHKVYSSLIGPFVEIKEKICQKFAPVFVRSYKNKKRIKRSVKNLLKSAAALVYNRNAKLESFILKKESRR